MLQQSIKLSLIASSVEQWVYLFLTRCCLLPIMPITLQRHPCPLGRQKVRIQGKTNKKKPFFWKLVQVVFETNGGRETHNLCDGVREEGTASSGRYRLKCHCHRWQMELTSSWMSWGHRSGYPNTDERNIWRYSERTWNRTTNGNKWINKEPTQCVTTRNGTERKERNRNTEW